MVLLESQKSCFSVFLGLKGLSKLKKKKIKNHSKPIKLIRLSLFIQFKYKPHILVFHWNFNHSRYCCLKVGRSNPCDLLCESKYRPTFKQQYLKNVESRHCLHKNFRKRIFYKLSNNIQVDRLCTCGSVVIDV